MRDRAPIAEYETVEARLQARFAALVGSISLPEIGYSTRALSEPIPWDRYKLIPVTAAKPNDPSCFPIGYNGIMPPDVTIEYYEEIIKGDILGPHRRVSFARGTGLGLTYDTGSKNVLIAISSAGIPNPLDIIHPQISPQFRIAQVQGVVRRSLQPRYAVGLDQCPIWPNVLVRAQEYIARRIGAVQLALQTPTNTPERQRRMDQLYGRVAREEGYGRRLQSFPNFRLKELFE